MKIILAVIKYNILNLIRNFKSAGIMFILPIVFMGIFAVAFGSNSASISFKTGVYVEDSVSTYAPDYNKILEDLDKDSKPLTITTNIYTDKNKLQEDIKSGVVDTGLFVFSNPKFAVLQTQLQMPPQAQNQTQQELPFKVELTFQEQNYQTQLIQSVLKDVVYSSMLGQGASIQTSFTSTQKDVSSFDLLAPGLIIYGLLILIPGIAQTFTAITEKRYIFRFANSQANSVHIITGSVIYYLLLSAIQILLLYLTAVAFGYSASGNVLYALVPGVLSALFVIGVGLLIGAFVKKTDAATNIGTIVSIILGFFSGSFISGIGSVLEFNLFGRTIQFNDLLPSKWGTVAIEKILSKNMQLSDITTELMILGISGAVLLLIGIIVYQKKQLNVQE
jgi:ABC-type multidrug transport system permease subunit